MVVLMLGQFRVLVIAIVLVGHLWRYLYSQDISSSGLIHRVICPNVYCSCLCTTKWFHNLPHPFEGGVVVSIKEWLHFVQYLVTWYDIALLLSTCSVRYMHWFRLVLHSYIFPLTNEDRSHILPHHRPHSRNDNQTQLTSQ